MKDEKFDRAALELEVGQQRFLVHRRVLGLVRGGQRAAFVGQRGQVDVEIGGVEFQVVVVGAGGLDGRRGDLGAAFHRQLQPAQVEFQRQVVVGRRRRRWRRARHRPIPAPAVAVLASDGSVGHPLGQVQRFGGVVLELLVGHFLGRRARGARLQGEVDLGHVVRAARRRRQQVGAHQLGGEVARPAREVPAVELAGGLGVVVHHVDAGRREQVVEARQRILDRRLQAHQHHGRLLPGHLAGIELGRVAFGDQAGAQLGQGTAKLVAGVAGASQQGDANR